MWRVLRRKLVKGRVLIPSAPLPLAIRRRRNIADKERVDIRRGVYTPFFMKINMTQGIATPLKVLFCIKQELKWEIHLSIETQTT